MACFCDRISLYGHVPRLDGMTSFANGSTVGPSVSLTLCCFVVYSMRRFVLSIALCYLCYLFLCFSILFALRLPRLGKRDLSAFRTFVRFALVWFCLFPPPLGVWKGLRLVIVVLHELFLAHEKTYNMACALSEDSDQPGHPPSLIRVFAVRSMGS